MKKYTKWLRYFARLIETLIAFVLVVISLTLYVLHDSPVDAKFLMQELERTILPDTGYHLESESVVLGSDFQKPGLVQIEIQNLKVLRSDNSVVVSIPQARLAYDFWHLVTLNYFPSNLSVKNLSIDLFLSNNGEVGGDDGVSEALIDEDKLKKVIQQLFAFRYVDIQDATVRFQNKITQKKILFSHVNLNLAQYFQVQEKIHFDADLSSSGEKTRLLIDGTMNRFTKKLDIKLGIPSIYLKPLGEVLPVLSGMNFSAQISVRAHLDLPKRRISFPDIIEKVNFQIKSTNSGTLNLPEPLTNIYSVKDVEINGVLSKRCKLLKIDQSYLTLTNGVYATLETEITGLRNFLNSGELKFLKTDFKSLVSNLHTNDIGSVWPRGVGTSTHDWVASHLSNGKMPQAKFLLHFVGDELVDLYGDIQAKGVTVNYLPPMPPVKNVQARIELFPDTVKIHVFDGSVDSLNVAGTEMVFTDVDIDPSWANIHLKAKGEVSDALRVLASKPLEFTQEYGIDIPQSQGKVSLETELFFKLDTESEPDEVNVKTKADIKEGTIAVGDPQIIFKNANLSLNLTNEIMNIKGKADILDMPLSINWKEYFNPKNNIGAVYEVSGVFTSNYLKKWYPDIEKFITGKMFLSGKFNRLNQKNIYFGEFEVDAKKAKINFYPLGQEKKLEQPCLIKAKFSQSSQVDLNVSFSVDGKIGNKSDNLSVQGECLLGKETVLKFDKVKSPETDISASYTKTDSDLKIELIGKKWNASQLLKMPMDILPDMVTDDLIRNVFVHIKLDQVIFNPQHPIKNILVEGKRQGSHWLSFHGQADLKDPLILIFDEKEKQFQGAYQDFGNLMASLGFETNILNGHLTLKADETTGGEIKGKIEIQDLVLNDPGFLMQALTILGVVDGFMGKNLVFDQVVLPFMLDLKNNLYIRDGLATGTSLGITLKGKVDDNILDIQGSLVPAYAINSLPGKIPVVGWLFKNTEGGGLINLPFTITGTIGNPDFQLHPLGTMKAGFLGNIFE